MNCQRVLKLKDNTEGQHGTLDSCLVRPRSHDHEVFLLKRLNVRSSKYAIYVTGFWGNRSKLHIGSYKIIDLKDFKPLYIASQRL